MTMETETRPTSRLPFVIIVHSDWEANEQDGRTGYYVIVALKPLLGLNILSCSPGARQQD